MTKAEAIEEMLKGNKVTHRSFTSNEWVTAINQSTYLFEDGVKCSEFEFWRYRGHINFDTDWELFKTNQL